MSDTSCPTPEQHNLSRFSILFRRFMRWGCAVVLVAALLPRSLIGAHLPLVETMFPQLELVLRDALSLSPRMVQQNLARLQAEQEAAAAAGRLRPQVNASLQYNLQYERRVTEEEYDSTRKLYYSLGAAYPLFSWGALQSEVEISAITAQIAAKNFREAYRLLGDQIRRAYLQLILEKLAVQHAEFSDQLTRRRLALLEEAVARGQAASAGLGSGRLDVNESALAVDLSRHTFAQALRNFQRLTGAAAFTAERVPATIPVLTAPSPENFPALGESFADRRGFAEDVRYEMAALELERERRNLHIARVAMRPRLQLLAGITEDELAYVSDIGQRSGVRSVYGAVSINWNIFDGFSSRGRMRAARTRVQLAEHRLATLAEDLAEGAKQAAAGLDLARRAMVNADDRLNASLGGHEFLRQEIAAGRRRAEDLDTSQVGVNAVERVALSARAVYLNALSAFAAAVNADPLLTSAANPSRPTP